MRNAIHLFSILLIVASFAYVTVVEAESYIDTPVSAKSKEGAQKVFCYKFEVAEDTVDVETILEQMEASSYVKDLIEFWTIPACDAPLKPNVKVPIIFNAATNAPKSENFPEAVHDYFIEDKKQPEAWLKIINSKSTDGLTFLDFLHYNLERGFYSRKPSKDAALRMVGYLCKNGGIYSRYSVNCDQNEDANILASLTAQANKGDISAQRKLGLAYEQGKLGLHRDTAKALHWYIAVARQGDLEMQRKIASLYFNNGIGFPIDGIQSIKWYEVIGDASSYRSIGEVYFRGISRIPVDSHEALKAWRKAAELGDRVALYRLGEYYTKLGKFAEAKAWFQKYADSQSESFEESSKAYASIGLLYIKGGEGLNRDYVQALFWTRKCYRKFYSMWSRIREEQNWLGIQVDFTNVLSAWEEMSQQGNVDAELILLRYHKNR